MKKKPKYLQILKNILITAGILAAAMLVCWAVRGMEHTDHVVLMIFVLAVLMTSYFTDGYVYGIAASLMAVILVNYLFTYPYFAFNFTITGYPITFLIMLAVALLTSMLTTQLKRQERMKSDMEKERMRSNLLRSVSHDIRTPLTAIVGSTSVILENGDKLDEEKKLELLKDVRDEAQWLIRIVENLLSVTRMNASGETELHKTPEMIEEILAEFVQKFKKRYTGIKIHTQVPDELLFVPMDAILIEQVIFNLLENAVLHGQTTENIWIRVKNCPGNVEIFVEDDGAGIDTNLLPHLFDGYPHHAAEQEKQDQRRNMGIGLSVCMSIIRAHGGTMRAKNRTEGGASFRFELPIEEEKNDGKR